MATIMSGGGGGGGGGGEFIHRSLVTSMYP